jgi:hypothetical protein
MTLPIEAIDFINQLEDKYKNDTTLICNSFIHSGFSEDIMIMLEMCFPPHNNYTLDELKDNISDQDKFHIIHSKFYENKIKKFEEGFITEEIFISVSELHNSKIALEMIYKYCIPLLYK